MVKGSTARARTAGDSATTARPSTSERAPAATFVHRERTERRKGPGPMGRVASAGSCNLPSSEYASSPVGATASEGLELGELIYRAREKHFSYPAGGTRRLRAGPAKI